MEYLTIVPSQSAIGNLYYENALKCVTENGTLSGVVILEPKDNKTEIDNKTIVKPLEEKTEEKPEKELESPFKG